MTKKILGTTTSVGEKPKTSRLEQSSRNLDIHSLVNAIQTLSQEIVLDTLLEKIMRIVIENAGAEEGFLLLTSEAGCWFVTAQWHADQPYTAIHQYAPERDQRIAMQIVQHTVRAGALVVLADAMHDVRFASDLVLVKSRIRSVLCIPLLIQDKLIGVLYLHNNLVVSAFTEDHCYILQLLSAQIAISIENANRYNHLKEKVTQKTQALSNTLQNLKETQTQLIETEKMASLGNLVAGVTHEINTPLGIGITASSSLNRRIGTLSSLFKAKKISKREVDTLMESVTELSSIILTNLDRVAKLVKSFKAVAMDQTSEERRTFEIKGYLDELIISLQPNLKQTPHTLRIRCPKDLKILSYPGAFAQVITNLIMNSILHAYKMGEIGHLSIHVRSIEKGILLEYADDGQGIEQANLSKIYKPFFTTKHGQGGTGLGLHLVYNMVVQILGGTIHCSSTTNQGTLFTITLPLTAPTVPGKTS